MKVKVGDSIVFLGYEEEPKEGEALLEEGATYEVVLVDEDEELVSVTIPNPDFNPKKKVSESNQETISVDVFAEEFEVAKGKPAKAAKAAKADVVDIKSAKGGKKAKQEDEAEDEAEDEEVAPAKPKAKAKTPAKAKEKTPATPAKSKVKEKAPQKEDDDLPEELTEEEEDEAILDLVNDADDILELAKETVEEYGHVDYRLGGILYHIRKTGAYKKLDKRYAEKGGFGLYVKEELNTEYRKAMYLVDIYYAWNKFGLEADKVAHIGWSKASKIAAVMDEDNAEELLALAEDSTVEELKENIKTNYKPVGEDTREKKVVKIFKFKLFSDQAEGVEQILQNVASQMGYKSLDEAFEHIMVEWASEHPLEQPKKPVKEKPPVKTPAKTKTRG